MKNISKILIIILVLTSLIYTIHNFIVFRYYNNKANDLSNCKVITVEGFEPSTVCPMTLEDAGTRDWAKTKTIVFGITTLAIPLLYAFWIKFRKIPIVSVFILLLLFLFSLPILIYTLQILFMTVSYGVRPIHYLEYIQPKL